MEPEPRATIQANPIRLYAGLVAAIERAGESGALGELLTSLRASGEMAPLPIRDDPAVHRWLARLGRIPLDAAGDAATDLLRQTAEATSRPASQVSLVFRLFAAGMAGVAKPVCGATPRCRDCGITKDCAFYNEPPRPADERLPLAKRLARDGAGSLGDEEILALILGGDRAGEEQRRQAGALLRRFGSLRAMVAAGFSELGGLREMSSSAASRLAASAELHRRLLAERRAIGPTIRSAEDLDRLFGPQLRDLKQEVFVAVLLDQKHRVLRDARVSVGTLTASLVHPREVFAPAIRESAAAIAFMHNHPSGDPTPSKEDRELTRRLADAGKLMGIPVLDHVIVGEGGFVSLADEGLL